MALYKTYTLLESKQIMDVSRIVKDKHKKPDISQLYTISDDILHAVYHDDRVRSVYDKKKITIGTLHHLFIKHNTHANHIKHHTQLIHAHEPHIDTVIRQYNDKKEKSRSKSRFSESCILL